MKQTDRQANMTELSIAFVMRATIRIKIVCRNYQQHATWLGLAWLGLAWLGLAWLGLAWLGLA